ncbi:MAG: hypothetical protein ACR2QX_12375 [Woeseiaceae bacterium]
MRLHRLAAACALPADILCLLPTPLQAVAGSMSQVVEKAEEFAQAASKHSEDFESHYRDNRKRAVAHAWEIAYRVNNDDERIAYEFALACQRVHRSKTAQAILDELAKSENKDSRHVSSAKLKIARLAWKDGDIDTAVMTQRSVRGRRARLQNRIWIGISTVRNGLLLGESGDADSAETVLMGGLIATGMNRDFAKGVSAIYLKGACAAPLDTLYASMPTTLASRSSVRGEPTPIILSGFGWSGTGAVADFLKGHSRVNDIFAGREIGLWTGRFGLDRLYAHFASRGFNRRLLLEFLARHCFGHVFVAHARGTKSFGGLWSKLDESQQWEFLGALGRWLEALQKWKDEPAKPILEPFQQFSEDVLRLFVKQRDGCVLLSNCIPSDSISGIRMFHSPVVISSWRDPGDAYASKKAAFPDNTLDLDGWREQLMSRIHRYLAGKKEVVGYARLWMDLSFEEFVHSNDLRQELLCHLNLHDGQMTSIFDPSVSAKNIGIFDDVSGRKSSGWNALAGEVHRAREEARCLSAADTSCAK